MRGVTKDAPDQVGSNMQVLGVSIGRPRAEEVSVVQRRHREEDVLENLLQRLLPFAQVPLLDQEWESNGVGLCLCKRPIQDEIEVVVRQLAPLLGLVLPAAACSQAEVELHLKTVNEW